MSDIESKRQAVIVAALWPVVQAHAIEHNSDNCLICAAFNDAKRALESPNEGTT